MELIALERLDISVIDGDRGKNYPHQDELLEKGDCLFLSAKNVTSNGFDFSNNQFITSEKDETLRNGRLVRGDIVITTRGTVGNVALYDDTIPYDNIRINSGMLIVRCGDGLSREYIYNVLRSAWFYLKIKSIQTGSAQPQLPKSHFLKMEIPVPDRIIQDKIADLIMQFDRKMACNHAINRNLWDQIDAWFYRLYTCDDAVRIMFGDVVTRCSERVKDDVVKVLSPVSTGEIVLSEDFFTKQVYSKDIGKYLKVNPYDFCYNPARANIGSIGMNDYDFTGCVSPVYVVFKTKNILKYYMSRYIRTDNFKAEVITRSSGSVRQALRYEDLVQIEFRKPNDYALEEFNEFYLGLKMKIESIKKENARLNDLRDCMLPRLMSGELDVSDLDML